MKKLLPYTFILLMCLFSACPPPIPPVVPTCSDGIKNGDETGVDCGGDCVDCFDCFSNYCVFLSDGKFSDPNSSIKWKCTKKDGETFVPDLEDFEDVILNTIRYTFHNKGDVDFMTTEGEVHGRWSFDDPDNPTEVLLTFPDGSHNDWTIPLISIEEGTFVNHWGEATATFEPE